MKNPNKLRKGLYALALMGVIVVLHRLHFHRLYFTPVSPDMQPDARPVVTERAVSLPSSIENNQKP